MTFFELIPYSLECTEDNFLSYLFAPDSLESPTIRLEDALTRICFIETQFFSMLASFSDNLVSMNVLTILCLIYHLKRGELFFH